MPSVSMKFSTPFSHLPRPRTRPLSLTWQVARAGINPRFLLTGYLFLAARFLLVDALLRPVLFLAVPFLAVLFLAVPFRPVLFFAVLLDALFRAVLDDPRFDALFRPLRFLFGLGGISAPERRASLNPIAIACFGFLTFLPLRPDSSS